MSIWFDNNKGYWLSDNYGEAYDKACDTDQSVYYGDRNGWGKIVNLRRVLRPQAPSLSIKGGRLRKKEKPDK